jgi:hypothetical protein
MVAAGRAAAAEAARPRAAATGRAYEGMEGPASGAASQRSARPHDPGAGPQSVSRRDSGLSQGGCACGRLSRISMRRRDWSPSLGGAGL